MIGSGFFTKRIYLDEIFNRRMQSGNHWVGSTFKSFAVIRTNNKNFLLSLVPNPKSGAADGLPLREGFYHNFKNIVDDAVFENTIVQPAVGDERPFADIIICTEDDLTSNPVQSRVETSTIELGKARGELDGLTRQIKFQWTANGGTGMSLCRDILNTSLNDGILDANGFGASAEKFFKMPAGYFGEIIGSEFNISPSITSPSPFYLYALNDEAVYTDLTLLPADCIGELIEGGSFTPGTAQSFIPRITIDKDNAGFSADSKGILRNGCILNENEVLVLGGESFYTNNASGTVNGYLLIRLKPIQETND